MFKKELSWNNRAQFDDVLSILNKYGDDILGQISLRTYNCLNKLHEPEVCYSCYDGITFLGSLFGMTEEYGLHEQLHDLDKCRKDYERTLRYVNSPQYLEEKINPKKYTQEEIDKLDAQFEALKTREPVTVTEYIEKRGVPNLRLTPGSMYFCQLESRNIAGDYGSDQTHFFLFIYDEQPTLIQAFGGVKGFTIKRIRSDINALINEILNFNHEIYSRLFEVSDKELLQFDEASFRAVKLPLFYPNLFDLDYFLQLIGLNFAKDKINFTI